MRRKRRAAAQEIPPGHAAGAIAQPRGSGSARRKFGKIDGIGGGGGKAQKNNGGYKELHPQSSLNVSGGGYCLPFYDNQGQFFGAMQD
jgi:hypothetical protein